jgi:hypothetical protein
VASEEVTKVNKRLTALAATQAAYVGDAAGRLDLIVQAGDAAMELTRLNGAEGRKGRG